MNNVYSNGNREIHPRPNAVLVNYFHHLAVELRNNHLSVPMQAWNRHDTYLSWTDASTRGKPEIYHHFSKTGADFEFPMNQIQVAFHATINPNILSCSLKTNMTHMTSIKVIKNDEPAFLLPIEEGVRDSVFMIRPNWEHGLILLCCLTLKPGLNRVSFQAVNGSGVEGPPAVFELMFNHPS